jgi:hypothetical protein
MKDLQTTLILPAILPGAQVNNASFTSQVIDTRKFTNGGYIELVGILGAMDTALTTLKVQEADQKTDDTTLGGSPADVVTADSLPQSGDANAISVFGIDLTNNVDRFVQLQATAGNGTNGVYLTALALGVPGIASSLAADRNLLFSQYV